MVAMPELTGELDGALLDDLAVEVCEWTGACSGPVTRLTSAGGGPERLRLESDHYLVNWAARAPHVEAGKTYRVRVLYGATELGHLDMRAVVHQSEADGVDTDAFFPVVVGRTVPIKFYIARGVIPRASFTVGGATQADEATTFDATGANPADADLVYSWSFGDATRGGGAAIAHVFAAGGSYAVTLTVANPAGYTARETRQVSISSPPAPSGHRSVTGLVRDLADGPLANVTVEVVGGGASAQTDARGVVSLGGVPTGVPAVLRLTRSGLLPQLVRLELSTDGPEPFFSSRMIPLAAPEVLAAAEAGGTVVGADGTTLILPAGALVRGDGSPVTGGVEVYLTPIDISGPGLEAFPGAFAGVRADGSVPALITLGVADFTMRAGGETLQIAPGASATIEIPVYDATATAGEVIPLWSLDERSALWVEEGTGVVVSAPGSPTGLAMRAEITHTTPWNVDRPVPPEETATVQTDCQDPLGAAIPCWIRGQGSGFSGDWTYTASGTRTWTFPADMTLTFTAVDDNLYPTQQGTATGSAPAGGFAQVTLTLEPLFFTPVVHCADAGGVAVECQITSIVPAPTRAFPATLSAAGATLYLEPGVSYTITANAVNATLEGSLTLSGTLGSSPTVAVPLAPVGGAGGDLVDGSLIPGSIDVPGEVDTYTFSGGAGERFDVDAGTPAGSALQGILTVKDAAGVVLGTGPFDGSLAASLLVTLPAAGMYTVVVDGTANEPGGYVLAFTALVPRARDANHVDYFQGHSDVDYFPFTGAPAMAMNVAYEHTVNASVTLAVSDPAGALVKQGSNSNTRYAETGIHDLSVAGTYIATVSTMAAYLKNQPYEVGLAEIQAPGASLVSASPFVDVAGSVDVLGDRIYHAVDLALGEVLSVDVLSGDAVPGGPSLLHGTVRITEAAAATPFWAGTPVADAVYDSASAWFQDKHPAGLTLAAPSTGTYYIGVDGGLPASSSRPYRHRGDYLLRFNALLPGAVDLTVTGDGALCPGHTGFLRSALRAVPSGGSVQVCPGTVVSTVAARLVTPNVTIYGAGDGRPVGEPTSKLAMESELVRNDLSGLPMPGRPVILMVNAPGAVVRDLAFGVPPHGWGKVPTWSGWSTGELAGTAVELDELADGFTAQDISVAPQQGALKHADRGIYVVGSAVDDVTVTGSLFQLKEDDVASHEFIASVGISLKGARGNVSGSEIDTVEVSGMPVTGPRLGIFAGGAGPHTITNNVVRLSWQTGDAAIRVENATATITGNTINAASGSGSELGIHVESAATAVIQNNVIGDGSPGTGARTGISTDDVDDVTVSGNQVASWGPPSAFANGGFGIGLWNGVQAVVLDNAVGAAVQGPYATGIQVAYLDRMSVQDNRVDSYGEFGISLYGYGSGAVLQDNQVGAALGAAPGSYSVAVSVWSFMGLGPSGEYGAVVTGNLVHGAVGAGRALEVGGSQGRVTNNRIISQADTALHIVATLGPLAVQNNTVRVDALKDGIVASCQSCSGTFRPSLMNNIVTAGAGATGIARYFGVAADYNLVFGFSTPYAGVGAGANDLAVDPLLDAATADLLHLLATSPAIDSGSATSCAATDYRGVTRPQDGNVDGVAVCDRGSYEHRP